VFYTAGLQYVSWFLFEDILYYPMNEYVQLGLWTPSIQPLSNEFYHTSAKLEGVREITPCHSNRRSFLSQITGLLLEYIDGSQRSIGQVRLDFLGTPKKVTTETMLIRFLGDEDSACLMPWHSGIQSFDFINPTSEVRDQDLKVPMKGRLDWITYMFDFRITHHENDEPQDEMRQVLAYEESQGIARSTPVCRTFSKVFGYTKMSTIDWDLDGHEIDNTQ
jgi:hypothetical protein